MAYPVVESSSHGSSTSASTSHVVTLPSGITAGDLLILCIGTSKFAGSNATATGWTYEGGQEIESTPTQQFPRASVLSRVADGSEGSTVTVSTDASKFASWIVLRVSGATDIEGLDSSLFASSNAPDPPAVSGVTACDNRCIAIELSNDETATVLSYCSGYSDSQVYEASGDTSGIAIALCSKTFTSTGEDPGAYSISTTGYCAAISFAIIGTAPSNTGSSNVTEPNDTCAASSTSTNSGSSSVTEPNDSSLGYGASSDTASSNVTEANDTSIGYADAILQGSSNVTEPNDTSYATTTGSVSASSSVTEPVDTSAGSSSATNSSSSTVTEPVDTSIAYGDSGILAASSNVTEPNDSFTSTSSATNTGSSNATEENDSSFSPSYSAQTPGHGCCCKCLVAEDDFNRADGDPGALWYGDGVIVSNALEADHDSVRTCHPGFAKQGSLFATCVLKDTTDGAEYKIRVGDPNGSLEVHVLFTGTVGTGTYNITVTDGDSGTPDETYDFQWQNVDEGLIVCYQPKLQLSAGPSTRSPAISGEAEWCTMCINKIGQFCWKRGDVSVGNWMFIEGTFDDFQMDVHWMEKSSCPKCNCFCTDMVGSQKKYRCMPKKLYLTLTELNCPGIAGTYEMNQVFIDSNNYDLRLYPSVVAWPQKRFWLSDPISCPNTAYADNAWYFVLQCKDSNGGVYPDFELTLVKHGLASWECSSVSFDPDDPDFVFAYGQPTPSTPETIAKAKPTSTCQPVYLEFPSLIEGNFSCSGPGYACCGGTIDSGGTISDPSYFTVIITE
jgi:hypothetical protein